MVAASWSIHNGRIHVETVIHAPMDALWERTQNPREHVRWDFRFSSIEPVADGPDGRHRFRYERRVVPGLTIHGTGENTGVRRRPDGSATSALQFASDDPRSIIRRGSGYWRYIPTDAGIRFLTEYDYEPRWGAIGRAVDRVIVRPLMAWATARSFDRLRRWLETGVAP
jgi:hypothetical protein